MDNKLLKTGDILFCIGKYETVKSRLARLGYQTESVDNSTNIDCVVLKITGTGSLVYNRGYHVCRECKYLTDLHKSVGNKCIRPNWKWRTPLAMWKSPTAVACVDFTPKENNNG